MLCRLLWVVVSSFLEYWQAVSAGLEALKLML